MFKIARWYNNYQAPAVLMIDDLSDAYIDVYDESYKNDWGYLCDENGSSYSFLKKELLNTYPDIKITFFTPYASHNVINENTKFQYKKYAVGERAEFTNFLKILVKSGHEIAHHGSNHGKYIDDSKVTTLNNWIHEWELFDNVKTGISITIKGIKTFNEICNINVVGGKYCGYISKNNSQEIIDKCNFLYWCDKPSYNIGQYDESFFGHNNIISFPTNYPGNSFVRLTYLSGDKNRDKKKKIFKYFQPLYNLYSYMKLYRLYRKGQIISIQEHNSPSTTAGTVQSANIITDIKSLNKIFSFLDNFSIWYATCENISKYIYTRDNSLIVTSENKLIVNFNNEKKLQNCKISVLSTSAFVLSDYKNKYISNLCNGSYVVNFPITSGKNEFNLYF